MTQCQINVSYVTVTYQVIILSQVYSYQENVSPNGCQGVFLNVLAGTTD